MTTYLDFLPLFTETVARVRARMDADANAGLSIDDPGYLDTREGTFYWDVTQTAALECVRLWDALGSETVAAAFPSVAWGDYLDEHAATFGLTRNPAIAAQGTVLVYVPAGTIVSAGAQFAAPPSDPSQDTVDFAATTSATAGPALLPPSNVEVTEAQTGGYLEAGTYYYHLTATSDLGQTNGTSDVSAVITSDTGVATITFSGGVPATGFNVFQSTTPDTMGFLLAGLSATATGFVDNGTAIPQTAFVEPAVNGTIGALCTVVAVVPGSAGNLSAGAINTLETAVPGVTNVTNINPTTGGEDTEDDEDLRTRILAQYTGQGSGTIANYQQIGLAYVGVERVTVIPLWAGPGTVLVVAYQSDGTPVTSDIVTGLQNDLDPVAGQGNGQAPIGATVTVVTTAPLAVGITATVLYQSGYSLAGSGGTIATQAPITAALTSYLSSLEPGDTIVFQQVQAAFFVQGVLETNGLTVNGGTSDIVLGVSPAQSATLGIVMLS
jgi:uncharacterized phage protein gp47/JayE